MKKLKRRQNIICILVLMCITFVFAGCNNENVDTTGQSSDGSDAVSESAEAKTPDIEVLTGEGEQGLGMNADIGDDGYTSYSFKCDWDSITEMFGYEFEYPLSEDSVVRNAYRQEMQVHFKSVEDEVDARLDEETGACRYFEIRKLPDKYLSAEKIDMAVAINTAKTLIEKECGIKLSEYEQTGFEEDGSFVIEFTKKSRSVISERIVTKIEACGALVYFEHDVFFDPDGMPEYSEQEYLSACQTYLEERYAGSAVKDVKLKGDLEGAYIKARRQNAVKLTVDYAVDGKSVSDELFCPYGEASHTDIELILSKVDPNTGLGIEQFTQHVDRPPIDTHVVPEKTSLVMNIHGEEFVFEYGGFSKDQYKDYYRDHYGTSGINIYVDSNTGDVIEYQDFRNQEQINFAYTEPVEKEIGFELAMETVRQISPALELDEYNEPFYIEELESGGYQCSINRYIGEVSIAHIVVGYDKCGNLEYFICRKYPYNENLPDYDQEEYEKAIKSFFEEKCGEGFEKKYIIDTVTVEGAYTANGYALKLSVFGGANGEFVRSDFYYIYDSNNEE